MGEVDTVSIRSEPETAAQVVRLRLTVHQSLERVDLGLRDRLEHGQFDDVAGAEVRDLELPIPRNFGPLFTINVVEQGPTLVHRGGWHSGWPVKLWLVPLGQSLLLLVPQIVALVRDVVLVEADFVED